MDEQTTGKTYTLLTADGPIESDQPGTLGGNRRERIYGRLDCGSAIAALDKGYKQYRVFFADESSAIAAGYRPCHTCLRSRYQEWSQGGVLGSEDYPWLVAPAAKDNN
jgi:hypothetical protein